MLALGVVSAEAEWFETPAEDIRLNAGETLVVYGQSEAVQAVEQRCKEPSRDHDEAVRIQNPVAKRERSEQKSVKKHGR